MKDHIKIILVYCISIILCFSFAYWITYIAPKQVEDNKIFTINKAAEKVEVEPKKYKRVTEISHETKTYVVTISKQSGGNELQRGAGGAIIGGGIDMLLGGSGGGGAVVGGLLGAATTNSPKVESYTETKTDIIYTIVFDNGSVEIKNNYLPYAVGDSLEIY